jgi:hypothetical protein
MELEHLHRCDERGREQRHGLRQLEKLRATLLRTVTSDGGGSGVRHTLNETANQAALARQGPCPSYNASK